MVGDDCSLLRGSSTLRNFDGVLPFEGTENWIEYNKQKIDWQQLYHSKSLVLPLFKSGPRHHFFFYIEARPTFSVYERVGNNNEEWLGHFDGYE
jgi:hypothetical protein